MCKLKKLVVGALAVVALSAVAPAIASAHEFLVEGKPVTGEVNLKTGLLTSGDWTLKTTVLTIKIEILCKDATILGGVILPSGLVDKIKIDFSECEVVKPAGCKVTEPIELNPLGGTLEKEPVEAKFKPESGETFVSIVFTGCTTEALNGSHEVTGTQTCALPKASESVALHEIECKATGSALFFGGNAATFEGSGINTELEGSKPWSAD